MNALAPALVESEMLPDGEARAELVRRIPVGRFGCPEEVVDLLAAMLANGYLTNQVVVLDGGIYPR